MGLKDCLLRAQDSLLHYWDNIEHHSGLGTYLQRNCWRNCFRSKDKRRLRSWYCKLRCSIGYCPLLDSTLLHMPPPCRRWMFCHKSQNLTGFCMFEHSIGYYLLRGSNLVHLFRRKTMLRCRFQCQTNLVSYCAEKG